MHCRSPRFVSSTDQLNTISTHPRHHYRRHWAVSEPEQPQLSPLQDITPAGQWPADDSAIKLPLQSHISLGSMRWHQKWCRPSAALKEGPSYGCWLDLGERLGGHLPGSPGSAKQCGAEGWAALYLRRELCLALGPSLFSGSPKKVKTPTLLPMGTGTVNSFSKDNSHLRLFYLSRRMKAVFLYVSWVRNARQAQASGPCCTFTCLFGPSMEAERRRTRAACHSISWDMAASGFGTPRLLPAKDAAPATRPLWQGQCFANFLPACTHLPVSTWLVWLHPNYRHLGGVMREWLPTALPAASSVLSRYDPQLRINSSCSRVDIIWEGRQMPRVSQRRSS